MRKLRKRIVAALLVVGIVGTFALTGCKTEEKGAASSVSKNIEYPKELNKSVVLRVAVTGWDKWSAALKEAGLDDTPYTVETSIFTGGNLCMEAMAADKIDFTATSEIPPISASLASNGGNFKIVAVNNEYPLKQELVVMKNSGIKSVADLRGKRVGYIKNTTANYFLAKMLEKAGLKWDDIDGVEISTADGVTALTGGSIDAFASYGNSINASQNAGAVTLESAETILSGNFPYEISDKALADTTKRAAAADFLARIQKALDWQAENLEKWASISADPTGQSYEDNLKLLKDSYAHFPARTKTIDDSIIKSEQSIVDTFYELGLVAEKIDASKLYDTSFGNDYKAALEKLNK